VGKQRGQIESHDPSQSWRWGTVENAISLSKRAIVGNHHKLSPWHLDRYMREFCWRYNRRRLQASIFDMALASMLNRVPLPYKSLVAF
jgi:ISXO2-like transposase domain